MAKVSYTVIATAVVTSIVLVPTVASGQYGRGAPRGVYPQAHITFEAFAGVANYGRFIEQYAVTEALDFAGQREVTADNALAIGASVGARIWQTTALRLGLTFSPTHLKFEDDSGLGARTLDRDDVADLDVFVLSLDILRFLLSPNRRLAPYASAGVTANWWNLGDGRDEVTAVDETQFRWGGFGSVGLQYRITRNFGTRLEVATMALGNPFDGANAYRTTTGLTFDEPTRVRLTRVKLGLTYSTSRGR